MSDKPLTITVTFTPKPLGGSADPRHRRRLWERDVYRLERDIAGLCRTLYGSGFKIKVQSDGDMWTVRGTP